MSRADAIERRIRGLDAAAFRAFVVDLWAARGFETRREGEFVIATRRGDSRVLYPLPRTRIGSPAPPGRPVDVVVAQRDGRAAREVAAGSDARMVDAAGLRETVRYGLDEATAAAVCERRLGAPPSDLRPPLRSRIRERVAAPSAGATALAGLMAVLVVGGLVVAGAPLTGSPAADAADAAGRAGGAAAPGAVGTESDPGGGAAAAETPTARPSWPASPAAVPGLDDDGVRDLFVLAAAHDRAISDRSYTLWIDYYGPGGPGANATRVHRDTDLLVDGDRRLAVTSVGVPDGIDDSDREVVRVVYRDGADRFVASSLDGTASYRRADANDSLDPGPPAATRRTPVRRYLSTPETDVTGTVSRDGRTHYRVVGTGTPAGLGREGVRNYTAVALVGPEGLVRELTATYTVSDGRNVSVRREWTYGRVGETTVDPPPWYAGRADNATGTPTPGTATPTPT